MLADDVSPITLLLIYSGVALMAASLGASWACLFLWPAEEVPYGFLLPTCGFYWLWAWKNRALGPLRTDGGVITFAPGMLAGLVACLLGTDAKPPHPALAAFSTAGAVLPAFNFLVPILWFVVKKPTISDIAEKYKKPHLWGLIFFLFCWGSIIFWPTAAVLGSVFGHVDWLGPLLGVPVVLIYVVASKVLVEDMNQRCVAPYSSSGVVDKAGPEHQ